MEFGDSRGGKYHRALLYAKRKLHISAMSWHYDTLANERGNLEHIFAYYILYYIFELKVLYNEISSRRKSDSLVFVQKKSIKRKNLMRHFSMLSSSSLRLMSECTIFRAQ
jgi:hypothetical protein